MSEHHDDEPIGSSGIEEGNAPIPFWLKLTVAGLFIFFVAYIIQYHSGVQPSSAQIKTSD